MKVFLGGTCNGSLWRAELIKKLTCEFFDPVVDDWNEEAQLEEDKQKRDCTHNLFVITPKMTGVFAIAEVVEWAVKSWAVHWKFDGPYPCKVMFCLLTDFEHDSEFSDSQLKSLQAVKDLLIRYNANIYHSLDDVADYLNSAGA